MSQQHVRDAMVPEPGALDAAACAQEAGERLSDPAVRAVLVVEDGRLVGVITRKTLVREIVAAGRDPRSTLVGEIFQGKSPFNDGTTVRTMDRPEQGFPIPQAPERPEEFAPGLTPELRDLAQQAAKMAMA